MPDNSTPGPAARLLLEAFLSGQPAKILLGTLLAHAQKTVPRERVRQLAREQVDALASELFLQDWFTTEGIKMTGNLLIPGMIPEPREHEAKYFSGAAALLYAMLEDAIKCFQKPLTSPSPEASRLAVEAAEWLFADDTHWFFSFVNICSVLEIDHHAIRVAIRPWQQGLYRDQQEESEVSQCAV